MRVIGNIGNDPKKLSTREGKPYYRFSLAESFGKDEKKTTTWYEVTAFVDETTGDPLKKGEFVEVSGRAEAKLFSKRDGSPGVSLDLTAFSVQPAKSKAAAA
ncbi:single-stranded DNA-binding protein [Ramlibacter alkalitolerans]|uniref:Single-stranded DNA-binding protein n=1 Tax=Ramlibacter alkalitolerans TaxID=2039631 RepID=A0ABS1JTZ2_9BURK|nr:single-stranded DNA-binding protein [Ramlibacter alkalitolerans]MBL0427765.1 single-stranded DNA-binding protein [Ramlibacter alkalitolerans]